MTHRITLQDAQDYEFRHLVAADSKSGKRLVCCVRGPVVSFEVEYGGAFWRTFTIQRAVNLYNSADAETDSWHQPSTIAI